jgi:hypothetical protein
LFNVKKLFADDKIKSGWNFAVPLSHPPNLFYIFYLSIIISIIIIIIIIIIIKYILVLVIFTLILVLDIFKLILVYSYNWFQEAVLIVFFMILSILILI